MLNKAMLIGNLGKDPEVRHLEGGAIVAKFSLATSDKYKNKSGETVKNTEWHNIEVWDKLAVVVEKYLKQGDSVYVEGKIKTEKYEEKYYTKIRAVSLTMLGGGKQEPQQQQQQPAAKAATVETDDLPF